MKRAAVLIGVSRTGGLDPLQAVESGVEAMSRWLRRQEVDPVVTLTDAGNGEVTAKEVKAAIKELCELGSVDQLFLYFAGHGVNLRFGEYWLLSGAPDDTQEAVNLASSEMLARHCGIKHVVIVSDACRTAASGLKAQNITGSEVFPNTGPGGQERPVDVFFAATLGHESLEIQDPVQASAGYRGVFTDALVSALCGEHPEVVERSPDDTEQVAYVRPWPLKEFLLREVDRRLQLADVPLSVFQEPDARITSRHDAWLARIPTDEIGEEPPPVTAQPGMPGADGADEAGEGEVSAHDGWAGSERGGSPRRPREQARHLLRTSLGIGPPSMPGEITPAGPVAGPVSAESLALVGAPYVTSGLTADAGFLIRGNRVSSAESWQGSISSGGDDGVLVGLPDGRAAADVLLTFEDASATVLPAVRGFGGVVTFDGHELIDVAWVPLPDSVRTADYQPWDADLRSLRALVSSSARLGLFRLEDDEVDVFARRIRWQRGTDPSLAVYAAYAFDDLRETARVEELQEAVVGTMGVGLFDVAMLSGSLDGHSPGADDAVFPSTPLLSRGWSTLRARGIRLDAAYDGIEVHLRPSLWTLLDEAGGTMARAGLSSGSPHTREETR